MFDGDRLEELRSNKGLTQVELGKILGVSGAAVSRYERGETSPSDDLKVKIANFFGVSTDYLLSYTRDEKATEMNNILILPKGFPMELKPQIYEQAERLHEVYKLGQKSNKKPPAGD